MTQQALLQEPRRTESLEDTEHALPDRYFKRQ